MKKLIIISLSLIAFTACTSENASEGGLSKTIQERDSLIALKGEISSKISSLEAIIEAADSTKKLTVITTVDVGVGKFERFFTVHGTLQTDQNAIITAQSMGEISSIRVKEGAKVSKGQLLAVINADVLKRQAAELENRMELAQTVFERQEKLWKQNIGSEIQYLQAKNDRDALKKSLQALQEQIDLSNIKAPFSGTIDEILPKEGETVGMGSPMFRLINLDDVYIKADVAENNLGKLKAGDTVMVSFPSLAGVEIKSTISRISEYINPNNRTFKVLVNIPNKNGQLKPNLLAELSIREYANDSAITIPENLIIEGAADKRFVFVASKVDSETMAVSKKDVKVGNSYNKMAEILSGLSAGDKVVDKGARSIQDGQVVEIATDTNF